MRGIFDVISKHPSYRNTPKIWHVTILQSDCFWWDLIVDPIAVDEKNPIVSYLDELRKVVEGSFEKRFIYYFASRPNVRFDARKPPYQRMFSKTLVINFLVGKEAKRVRLKRNLLEYTGGRDAEVALIGDKFIRFYYSRDHSETYSVHDFVQIFDIKLGVGSRVHYVGITKNPGDRPLSRKHRGVSDTLYKFRDESLDFFVFINLYKVIARSVDRESLISYYVANTWTDDVLVDAEGAVIEHSLVAYFDSLAQEEKNSRERAQLVNNLQKIQHEKNIVSVLFDLEIDSDNEYFNFYSEKVSVCKRHVFLCKANNNKLSLDRLDIGFNTEKFFADRM